jgi:hypothetical protein
MPSGNFLEPIALSRRSLRGRNTSVARLERKFEARWVVDPRIAKGAGVHSGTSGYAISEACRRGSK